ncbi:amino acid transporter [Aureobasidium namibiae CBS 147.97]|uniref:Amino acid transporter n=1 Tax=Aureobasidium namibiae CBS 147.97 TaxID=1043004 RepID=A0A074WL25_9PEZI|nr:amino acid transporter [Aureobasidium namibiae CBS 147.97]KEQ70512.1 amino acid transporter [Aureobasidium namibiae CBS 147.97]
MADEKGLSHAHTASDNGVGEIHDLTQLGYTPELTRNRSMLTLLFQCLAIAAIPYGEGSPLMSAIYGGGQLSIFVGWIVVCVLDECIALSLGELASRYPTSAGPYYWTFQLSSPKSRKILSFINAWTWLIGNWTITLSVNFGFASLIAGAVGMYHPDYAMTNWELLLIFYALVIATLFICALGNKFLPMVDTICAAFTAISIIIILIALASKADAGRHSAAYALSHYDKSFSGYGNFTFFIGLLPAAYCFSALGMIASMAEECDNPSVKVPRAIALCVPVGGIAGLFFVIPICVLLPNLADIVEAPAAQALPFIFHRVMGSPGGGLGLTFLVLIITLFCSISITTAASRCTWAAARDHAIPFSNTFASVNTKLGVPLNALLLVTLLQLLLGLINLGSTSAFTAFVSVGVIALAISYAIPIALSLLNRRKQIATANWKMSNAIGYVVNIVAVAWIGFELILFSMPGALPVTEVSMNYASVVLFGFLGMAGVFYACWARKVYKGPPESDAIE